LKKRVDLLVKRLATSTIKLNGPDELLREKSAIFTWRAIATTTASAGESFIDSRPQQQQPFPFLFVGRPKIISQSVEKLSRRLLLSYANQPTFYLQCCLASVFLRLNVH
jgi:hypothetical protein